MEFCMEEFEKALGDNLACKPEWMVWNGRSLEIKLLNGKCVNYYWWPERNDRVVKSAKRFIRSNGRSK